MGERESVGGQRRQFPDQLIAYQRDLTTFFALSIARGSVAEIEMQLTLAQRLSYVDAPILANAFEYCDAMSRMITNLKRVL